MNIVLNMNQFNIDNLNIMEMKKNKLMNGVFTKITYNDDNIQLNGIYVKFDINKLVLEKKEEYQSYFTNHDYTQENKNTRYDVNFSILDSANLYNVNEIIRIETELLYKYKEYKKQYETIYTLPHKKKIYSIKYNLLNGQYKMYTDKIHLLENHVVPTSSGIENHVVPISSGIENHVNLSGIENHVKPTSSGIENMSFMFKISGIWEDDSNIGITYKIIHCI